MASQAALDLIIQLKGDADAKLRSVAGAADEVGKKSSFLRDAFAFATGGAVLSGISAVAGGLASMFTGGLADAREANQLFAQTQAVITSTGGAAGVTAQQVADMASQLSDASGASLFGDDQIQASTNLLLTFTNIKGAALEAATAISVDMAQALGGEPKDAAIQLGKALNDPIAGISALTRVGVTFTDQQKEQIRAMQDAGNMAGAQQVILNELNKEFGGSAKAAADASGGWSTFQGALGEAAETVAAGLLPVLGQLGALLSSPAVMGAISSVAEGVGTVLGGAIGGLISTVQTVSQVISANIVPILGTLAASLAYFAPVIYSAVIPPFIAWATSAAASAAATVAALAPVLIPIAAIGAAVALLKVAWDNDWGGIKTTLTDWWTSTGQPIFDALRTWLADTLTAALSTLAGFWTGTLQPALAAVWGFISGSVIPLLVNLGTTVFGALQSAISTLAGFWTGTLQPALNAVWSFLNQYIIPIITGLIDVQFALLGLALRTLAGYWQDTLKPAMEAVWSFIQTYLAPVIGALVDTGLKAIGTAIQAISDAWTNYGKPAFDAMQSFISTYVTPILDTVKNAIDKIIWGLQQIKRLIDSLPGMPSAPSLPATPGVRSVRSLAVGGRGLDAFPLASSPAFSGAQPVYILVDARGATDVRAVEEAGYRGAQRALQEVGLRADARRRLGG